MTEIPLQIAAELARLQGENARARAGGLFEAPPRPVHDGSPPEAKVAFFGTLFAARADVYAVRFDNRRTGRAGWVPAVRGGWRRASGTPTGTACR